jgi:hypothetical protein
VMMIGAGRGARAGADMRTRLDALADAVQGGSRTRENAAQNAGGAAGLPAWEPFRSSVEGRLRRLEDTLALGPRGEGDATDALLAGT